MSKDARTAETRRRLMDGALETVRAQGISGASARSIAATAGVNQALIFYHFGSVDELLGAACLVSTESRVAVYRERLATVRTLRELLDVGRELQQAEREAGNVTVLAQMLAGSQGDPKLAEATRKALALWVAEIELTVRRLLAGSPLAELADPAGLARAAAAGFIGIELWAATDPEGAEAGLAALEQLTVLVEVVDGLGPVARRALKAKVRAANRSS
ncbi:AcrR family transcriptional regulator [Crossiella equi]|uniref:AcrR family transcriptional regulator n=1 Tax=Crossiella equi TaxID=130796 RepID=A0ABS5ADH1_9PSEU|nr:TetR/AcrR family transcriptional regulator [Crossiella equi]MBP2474264.1 AcrR family transcriptional regulator [Crossiella equi]